MASLIQKWQDRLAATRDNETGAETIEIIIFLAIFVLGMVGVWLLIRSRAKDKGDDIANCLDTANTQSAINNTAC